MPVSFGWILVVSPSNSMAVMLSFKRIKRARRPYHVHCDLKEMIKFWVVPPPSNSHHQDYYIFGIGDPNLNLHLPHESWEGGQPKLNFTAYFKDCQFSSTTTYLKDQG